MKVLAIETSCDETGIALVEGIKEGQSLRFTTLKAALLSQAALHAPYGGIYPNLAKREHQKNLPVLFEQFKDDEYDAVAVTVGPGLEPALWQGVEFAKKIAQEKKIPLLPVNHMEGHLISSLAEPRGASSVIENTKMPVLALLVSGGHTEYVLMEQWLNYKIIGRTQDDAVGEAFDKVARMLGLPYPGGPEISKIADKHRRDGAKQVEGGLSSATARELSEFSAENSSTSRDFVLHRLPRPMLNSNSCDVSFSGLKTAALYALRKLETPRSDLKTGLSKVRPLTQEEKAAFAAEFEDAVADVLVSKTRRAMQETGAQTFVLGGGVAANRYLREKLQQLILEEFPEAGFRLPELSITGDNAIMIAQAALARALSGINDAKKENGAEIRAVGNLSIASSLLE